MIGQQFAGAPRVKAETNAIGNSVRLEARRAREKHPSQGGNAWKVIRAVPRWLSVEPFEGARWQVENMCCPLKQLQKFTVALQTRLLCFYLFILTLFYFYLFLIVDLLSLLGGIDGC